MYPSNRVRLEVKHMILFKKERGERAMNHSVVENVLCITAVCADGEGPRCAFWGQGWKHGDCIRFLQAGVSPALKASLQPLAGCYRFHFPVVQTSENWCLKHLASDKYF